jgi:hypothetical protein
MKFGYSGSDFVSFLKKLGDSILFFRLNLKALFFVSGEGNMGGLFAEVWDEGLSTLPGDSG